MMKEVHYQIKGMSQDLAYQLFNPQYAFECKNIRINTTDENSLLSISNERGNLLVSTIQSDTNKAVQILGVGQFSEYCVLFGKITEDCDNPDVILKMDNQEKVTQVFRGNLDFDSAYPIRTICVYENERMQKVYWVDGKNQPRVLNIAGHLSEDTTIKSIENQKIDFLPKLKFQETVSIKRVSGGKFPAGIIQYAFTYSDKGLQESNLWYVSPMYYITQTTKGAEAGSICNVAFQLEFSGIDNTFDYMQIYAIVRTSLNATPACYKIANIPTTVTNFTDTGSQWEACSADIILGKQLGTFVPETIASKDSTLFLGNYTLTSPLVYKEDYTDFFKSLAKSTSIQFRDSLYSDSPKQNLEEGANSLQTFRSGEYYRLGVQFQDEYGTPSNVIYLKDIQAGTADPDSAKFMQKVIMGSIPAVPEALSKFKRARLLMVDRTNLPHRTLCQGVLCPTVYTVSDRVNNRPFAMNSWCMRGFDALKKDRPTWEPDTPLRSHLEAGGAEIESQLSYNRVTIDDNNNISDSDILVNTSNSAIGATTYYYIIRAGASQGIGSSLPESGRIRIFISMSKTTDSSITDVFDGDLLINRHSVYLYQVESAQPDIATNAGAKAYLQNLVLQKLKSDGAAHPERIVQDIFSQWEDHDFVTEFAANPKLANCFFLGTYSDNVGAKTSDAVSQTFDDAVSMAKSIGQPFFCDHNILTFHSPDVERYQSIIDNNPNIKYRIVGYTDIENSYFDSYIQTDTPTKTAGSVEGVQTVERSSRAGIYNSGLWRDSKVYQTYIWHRSMTLGGQREADDGKWYGGYSRKILSNVHKCGPTLAFRKNGKVASITPTTSLIASEPRFPDMGTPRVFNFDEVTALQVDTQPNSKNIYSKLIYYGNVNTPHFTGSYYIPINENGELKEDTSALVSDPCLIRFKSTPHVVMPMAYFTFGTEEAGNLKIFSPSLPYPSYAPKNGDQGTHGYLWSSTVHGMERSWLTNTNGSGVDDINYQSIQHCLLYVAELYQDLDVSDIYGLTDEEALSKHVWIPISTWVPLQENTPIVGYGDAFIGRWECLKSYAFSEDDMQSYIDITSFVVESDTNLESRYDNYKGATAASTVSASKFNLFNPVYDQKDNLFSYRSFTEWESISNFQNQICWSEVKTLGEEIDTWCQINIGNNIDLQGEYGKLRGLVNSNNSIYCFQDNAVYRLNYNTRVIISPSDGVPIQLTNNYRVEPPILLRINCGVLSQDDLVKSSNSLYFLDQERGRIFSINEKGEVLDLSSLKGVNSLIAKLGVAKKALFDPNVRDVYFNFQDTTLCYNEDIMEFTSLYDYNSTDFLFSLGGNTYASKYNSIFRQRAGAYSNFFEEESPYYIEMLANDSPLKSKTFTNVEFTMASDTPTEVFNKVEVKTSYQEGDSQLVSNKAKPSNLKRKFRLWRITLPRHKEGTRETLERMRDTWCKVKLSRTPIEGSPIQPARINHVSISYLPD